MRNKEPSGRANAQRPAWGGGCWLLLCQDEDNSPLTPHLPPQLKLQPGPRASPLGASDQPVGRRDGERDTQRAWTFVKGTCAADLSVCPISSSSLIRLCVQTCHPQGYVQWLNRQPWALPTGSTHSSREERTMGKYRKKLPREIRLITHNL